jgi:hypothetical protein
MHSRRWLAGLGLALTVTLPAYAEITAGLMAVRGCEMS